MKLLITGTAGFIGYHLAKKLLERGDAVVGIDNINDYYDVNLKFDRLQDTGISREAEKWHKPVQSSKYPGYTFVRMNLEDREQMFDLFEAHKFDRVCNLAAQAGVRYSIENPYAYIDSNIVGFINILEACRHHKVEHLAYASSSSVYGNNTKMPLSTSDSVDHPISLYAATKKSNELMAHTYSHLYGIPTTGLRFFTVYGPWGRPDMALFLFTKAIQENKPIKVFNHGKMVRDFTFVDDIVEGVTRVIDNPPVKKEYGIGNTEQRTKNNKQRTRNKEQETKNPEPETRNPKLDTVTPSVKEQRTINKEQETINIHPDPSVSETAPYKVYNIGNSSPVELMDYIGAVEKYLGKEAEKEYLPMQPGDVPKTDADVTDLQRNLNYKPNTTVDEGIRRFVRWYKEYYG